MTFEIEVSDHGLVELFETYPDPAGGRAEKHIFRALTAREAVDLARRLQVAAGSAALVIAARQELQLTALQAERDSLDRRIAALTQAEAA